MKPTVIREDFVRAKAKGIVKEKGFIRPPVDIEKICNDLGVDVRYYYAEELEASFTFLHNKTYYIIISLSGYHKRDMWSLAHELGHVVLKHCEIYEHDTLMEDRLTDRERYILDREADIFAEELLMPLEWIEKHKSLGIARLTDIFNVSKEAMLIRLSKIS